MKNFFLVSKKSIIGLILKIIGFSFLVNQLFNFIEKIIGEHALINWILILIVVFKLIYNYFTNTTSFSIEQGIIFIQILQGFPKRKKVFDFILEEIKTIKLIQSHETIYGKKEIELINKDAESLTLPFNVRYYQMVKIQEYLQQNTSVEALLIG